MNRWIANTLGCVSILAVCLIGWAAWRLGVMADRVPDLTATVAKTNQALDTVNRPCAPGPCGTLANIDKLTVKVGDLAVTSQRQVAQTDVLVTSVAAEVQRTGETIERTGASAQRTLDAATGTLQEGQRTLAAFQPVLGHADATVADLDAALKADAGPFNATLVNVQNITGSTARITNDAERVADDATEKYFKPEPWYKKAVPALTVGAKIAAYALPW
jgi:hypothetical protein